MHRNRCKAWVYSGKACTEVWDSLVAKKVDDSLRPPWLLICFSPLYSLPCITKELKHAAKCLLIIQQYINSSTDQTSPIYREFCTLNSVYIYSTFLSENEQNLIYQKTKTKTLFRLDQQSLLHFPYSTEANELARNCVLRENYGFWVNGSLSCRAYARGNSEPLPQAETAVEVWGCSGITIYTHRFTKKYCHTSYWLCHEYQWLFFFWTHSTKQTVKNVHAWLCSTWPSPYIQFNGIMNTQYKGIVHDTQLLCTMHELCHWFCSFKGLYFW